MLKKVRRSFSYDDFIVYKKAQAFVRRVIRTAKRNYWREYCNNIGGNIEINEVWNMIRTMGGKQRNNSIPTIIHNEEVVVSDSRKAEILAQTFVKVHSNENISNDMMKIREQSVRKNPHILEVKESTGDTLVYEFT